MIIHLHFHASDLENLKFSSVGEMKRSLANKKYNSGQAFRKILVYPDVYKNIYSILKAAMRRASTEILIFVAELVPPPDPPPPG